MTAGEAPPPPVAEVAKLLLLGARVMLEGGANASRIEETVARMGLACHLDSVSVFCTLTGIFVTVVRGEEVITRLLAVKRHGIDLGRIADVNELSRQMEAGEVDFAHALARVRELVLHDGGYPASLRLLARGLSSAAFAVLMGGSGSDFLPAFLAGIFASAIYTRVLKVGPEFVAIYFAALVGTLGAVLAAHQGFGNLRYITVGLMMPLVPGMALTNSIRDLIFGDLLSGLSRGAEAVLSAAAVAGGVYTVLVWFRFSLWI